MVKDYGRRRHSLKVLYINSMLKDYDFPSLVLVFVLLISSARLL